MAADFLIKKDDTYPPITAILQRDGSAIDLSGATVQFQMALQGESALTVDAAATVTDAENGEVEYSWDAADTDVVGIYEAEFVITYASGRIETFPNDHFLYIEIVEDL